jgi:hypothetical protein
MVRATINSADLPSMCAIRLPCHSALLLHPGITVHLRQSDSWFLGIIPFQPPSCAFFPSCLFPLHPSESFYFQPHIEALSRLVQSSDLMWFGGPLKRAIPCFIVLSTVDIPTTFTLLVLTLKNKPPSLFHIPLPFPA